MANTIKTRSNFNAIFSHFWIMFFPIASYYFYGYIGFNDKVCKAIFFFALPFTLLVTLSNLIRKYNSRTYQNIIRLIFVSLLGSMVMSYIFWGQSLVLSYRSTAVYLSIIYFFYLVKIKPSLALIEKVIGFLCLVYVLVWVYALSQAPKFVVGIPSEFEIGDDRGLYRIMIYGNGILELYMFLAINKYKQTSKIYWLTIAISLFTIIILHLTRQTIIISFIFGLYLLLKNDKRFKLKLVLSAIVLWFVYVNLNNNRIFTSLTELTKNQIDQQTSGDEYIRIKEYKYYFTELSKNLATDIFGNGVYHSESSYGKQLLSISLNEKYYLSDVGYADIFIKLGILGLIGYGWLFLKVVKQKIQPKFMYAKIYIIYLFVVNFGSSYLLYNTILLCFCLYILEIYNRDYIN